MNESQTYQQQPTLMMMVKDDEVKERCRENQSKYFKYRKLKIRQNSYANELDGFEINATARASAV